MVNPVHVCFYLTSSCSLCMFRKTVLYVFNYKWFPPKYLCLQCPKTCNQSNVRHIGLAQQTQQLNIDWTYRVCGMFQIVPLVIHSINYVITFGSNIWRRKQNEMNGVVDYIRTHAGWTGPGEPLEDGKTNEMTLPFRHRIRNSSPGGLRGSPQYWILASQQGINILFLWNLKTRVGLEPAIADFPKQAALNTAPGPPPRLQH